MNGLLPYAEEFYQSTGICLFSDNQAKMFIQPEQYLSQVLWRQLVSKPACRDFTRSLIPFVHAHFVDLISDVNGEDHTMQLRSVALLTRHSDAKVMLCFGTWRFVQTVRANL
jgi:hypothetical protein